MKGMNGRWRPLRTTGLLSVLLLLATSILIVPGARAQTPGEKAQFDPSRSDEKAIAIADNVAKAMGGADTWTKAAFIKFTSESSALPEPGSLALLGLGLLGFGLARRRKA